MNAITAEKVLDSRDIIDRAQDLIEKYLPAFNEQQVDDGDDDLQLESDEALHDSAFNEWLSQCDDDERRELHSLLEVWRECEHYSDWSYGEMLIRDDYFTDYVYELCEDCGYIPKDFPSWIEVDWDRTADNVKADYTYIELLGEQYWIRCV